MLTDVMFFMGQLYKAGKDMRAWESLGTEIIDACEYVEGKPFATKEHMLTIIDNLPPPMSVKRKKELKDTIFQLFDKQFEVCLSFSCIIFVSN